MNTSKRENLINHLNSPFYRECDDYEEAEAKAKPSFDKYWEGLYTKYGITDPEEDYYLDPNDLKMYKEVKPTRLQYKA